MRVCGGEPPRPKQSWKQLHPSFVLHGDKIPVGVEIEVYASLLAICLIMYVALFMRRPRKFSTTQVSDEVVLLEAWPIVFNFYSMWGMWDFTLYLYSNTENVEGEASSSTDNMLESIATLLEMLRFTYSETIGKWPIADKAFGINYFMRKQVQGLKNGQDTTHAR
ncbi:hypothetical protein JHK85_020179 [Glycine max]|nr:hypothetical protein JHK85_020179 [Glycine max]